MDGHPYMTFLTWLAHYPEGFVPERLVRPCQRPHTRRTGPGDRRTPKLWLIVGLLTVLHALAMSRSGRTARTGR